MDLLGGYGSGEEGPTSSGEGQPVKLLSVSVSAAPDVETAGLQLVKGQAVPAGQALHLQHAAARQVMYNLPVEQMHAPVMGPAHHNQKSALAGLRNHRAGHVEDANLSSYSFDEQYNMFHSKGVAADPSGTAVVRHRDLVAAGKEEFETAAGQAAKRQKTDKAKKQQPAFDPSQPFSLRSRQPWAEKEAIAVELTEEEKEYMDKFNAEKAERAGTAGGEGEGKEGRTSVFHGKAETDYQGRSWLECPKERSKREADACFLPKRHIHTWSGHTKGVNAIRFFPETGHLLLSAGLDGNIKIWDVNGHKKCMRTYMGHTKGVKDIWFSNDGRRFVSTGYDKKIRYWDTETGAIINTVGEGKMSYCVRLHPEEQHVVLAGTQEKKIMQWDLNTGDMVQVYDYHLGAINTVTFIDQNRRFVTTSDDKTIRMWEYGIQAQAKYIADPSMHAIATAAVTPNQKWWCGQSMDNTIVTYSADRLKPNKKKTFKGHLVAGYACQVAFSWDSRFVMSGDGEGKLFIWDWKSTKIVRSMKCHDSVLIDAQWHPLETSKVATCSWANGDIKLWD
ncbi:pre-mRNA-processing factor 17-like isoform X1 [Chlorella sorokiniana]|uniref:Pre-mRNA-processing factor 17 n=1 Tax=Chlorella sorokiniana TaxID=3076 RepID=A0A2P6TM94_CHLSO|nr:pre-mRNA-processing factor 17-like isoform X1 [Chlorella sorokiniana]|eukprot:PRW45460.1 pre-mRNA-processing factor 17-like isoform X1 [Chlorella sorokiniana]